MSARQCVAVALVACLLCACQSKDVRHTYLSLPHEWAEADTLRWFLSWSKSEPQLLVGVRYFEDVDADTICVGVRSGAYETVVMVPLLDTYGAPLGQGNVLYTQEVPCPIGDIPRACDTLFIYNGNGRTVHGVAAVGVRLLSTE